MESYRAAAQQAMSCLLKSSPADSECTRPIPCLVQFERFSNLACFQNWWKLPSAPVKAALKNIGESEIKRDRLIARGVVLLVWTRQLKS